jgi:sulfoxide reductase heme-binding subunit YedZ
LPNIRFAKLVVLVNSFVPLALLIWDYSQGHLRPDPINFALTTTGMLALVFLLLSLTVTPLRLAIGQNWPSNFRRMLGLIAFTYGCLHLTIYFCFYQNFSLSGTIDDTIRRPFILFGMSALLLMVPLAVTSTAGMVKRLGAKRWKRLHKLVYICATLAVLHYFLLVKADTRKPLVFAAILGILLLIRLEHAAQHQKKPAL